MSNTTLDIFQGKWIHGDSDCFLEILPEGIRFKGLNGEEISDLTSYEQMDPKQTLLLEWTVDLTTEVGEDFYEFSIVKKGERRIYLAASKTRKGEQAISLISGMFYI